MVSTDIYAAVEAHCTVQSPIAERRTAMDLPLFFLPVLISFAHYILADVRKLHREPLSDSDRC
jgi:hypothetical protein